MPASKYSHGVRQRLGVQLLPCPYCVKSSILLLPSLAPHPPTHTLLQALGLKEFLLPMLNLVPNKRATAAEMLQHPWLRGELPSAPPRGASQQGRGSRLSRESSREERRGSQRRASPSGRDQRSRSPKRSRLVWGPVLFIF
jgi:hypothetical protein